MTESGKEELHQKLESKIENMLDKLIEADEDLENNGDQSSLKFSDDISSDDVNKNEEDEHFEKELFNTQFFQNEEKSQPKNPNIKSNIKSSQNIQNSQNNLNRNFLSQLNLIYNNTNYNNPFSSNYIYPISINFQNNKSNPNLFGMVNNNCNNNNINQLNNDTLNTTTASFSSNFDNSYSMIPMYNNNNNSFMNFGYQNFNNSFNNENGNFIFNRSKKYHNSFFAGDKICFNQKLKNYQNNYKNNKSVCTNVELEILLIEVNKILNKIEKIDQIFFNKLKGKFEQIIRTHKGSRIFQNYLKNTHTDILHQIFVEIKNKLPELLKDNYANYFCKKFFDCLNQKDRIEYLIIIQNDLKTLAIDITATYPIQGIIEQLGSKAEKKIIYLGIKDSINTFCYNVYGTHVIEKILSYFEDEFTNEIIDYIYNNFIGLAYNINGICVVKKLLLMTHKKDLHQKLKQKIIENALNLIVHQYGNYVIQVIFENWDDNELEDILKQYKNNYIYLSKLKYSSNAIERIIEKNKNNLDFYIKEICIENNISELILNNYGNYVIQKALKLSSGIYQNILIQEIYKNLYIIEDKKIINKWKMIISSKFSH
jgi:hypothetical protein